MDAILIRRDVQGKNVVFFPDSYNKIANKIQFWDGQHGTGKQETSADYYFTSKPAEDKDIATMSEAYSKEFDAKQILVRRRLYKEHVMPRITGHMNEDAAEGGKTAEEMHKAQLAFREKLKAAIIKAIDEAIPA